MLIYLLKIVIFNSHVSLPEDIRDAKRLSGFFLFLLATTGSGLGAGHPLLKTGEVSVNQRQITATPSSVSLYHQKCGSSSNRFTGRYPPFQRQKASQLDRAAKDVASCLLSEWLTSHPLELCSKEIFWASSIWKYAAAWRCGK